MPAGKHELIRLVSPIIIPIPQNRLITKNISFRSSPPQKNSGKKMAPINKLIPIPTTNNMNMSVFRSKGYPCMAMDKAAHIPAKAAPTPSHKSWLKNKLLTISARFTGVVSLYLLHFAALSLRKPVIETKENPIITDSIYPMTREGILLSMATTKMPSKTMMIANTFVFESAA